MIELKNVRKVYPDPDGPGEVAAVDGVSLTVPEGETLCLIGTSGCGKTTTMKLINGLIRPSTGDVSVGGRRVADQDPIRLRRQIGYVIQKGGLFPHMTVGRNIGLLCELEGWPRDKTTARVAELMNLVNLPPDEYVHRYPNGLSGGQRQRVGVARALALDPDYMLMDEPFGALDPITRRQIHDEFADLQGRLKKTVVIVTHDLTEAFQLGDKIAVMDRGKVVQHATPAEIKAAPATDFVRDFVATHLEADTHA